ncbi:MAG: hypothetical protein ACM3ZQ_11535 [Bacillota bacterium]
MTRRGDASMCFGAAYTSQGYMTMLAPLQQCRSGQVIVVRGGPLAARSKIMERAADDLLERGFSLERYRHCIDPNLISGFCLLSPLILVLDEGMEEPIGATDLIPNKVIDIGPSWDYAQLQSQKKALCTLSWQNTRRLQIVASYLRELGTVFQERKSYISDSMDFGTVNRATQQIIAEILARKPEAVVTPNLSPLFVTAITAGGLDHCVNSIVSGFRHFYLLRGEPGSGRSTILARVSEQAAMHGLSTRSLYGPLEPERRELLLIPSLATALVGGFAVRSFRPNDHRSLTSLKVIELGDLAKKKRLSFFQPERTSSQQRFDQLLELTVKQLAHWQQITETITAIYQEYVDQSKFAAFSEQLLRYVLELIDARR